MQAVMKIKDDAGHISTDKIDYKQNNEDIRININSNGHLKQYKLKIGDVGALMDNLNATNLEQRLLQLGKSITPNKSRKHKSRKHKSRKHKSRKHKSRKHKTRKTRHIQTRTPTPYPHAQL